jgi:hypothetical protein
MATVPSEIPTKLFTISGSQGETPPARESTPLTLCASKSFVRCHIFLYTESVREQGQHKYYDSHDIRR